MRSLRSRLVLSHILPLLVVVPLAGAVLSYVIETQVVLSQLALNLTERANLIVDALEDQPQIWGEPGQAQVFVTEMGDMVGGQIYLFNPSGVLIAAKATTDVHARGAADLEGLEIALSGHSSQVVYYSLFKPGAQVLVPVLDARQALVGIVAVTQTLEGITSQIGRLRTLILVILVVELILGAVIGYTLANRLALPIGRAAEGAIDIADGKDIAPIPVEGPTEIKRLSASVNILAERLRILEETRRRSLANIVHEIGRPLGAIQSAVHVLLRGPGEDPQIRQELLEGIDGEINRMRPLLDDLSQLHGQVAGELKLDLQKVALSDWLPTVLLPWRAAALEKGVHWVAEIPPNLPTLNVDPDRMAQVIGNLVSNAIKYTPKGGSVLLAAGSDENETWVKVSDTGPGIVVQEQGRIFEPFYRSQQERRFPQGLGLGLTIARDLVDAHGGRLELNSIPGQGSQFTIYLPLSS